MLRWDIAALSLGFSPCTLGGVPYCYNRAEREKARGRRLGRYELVREFPVKDPVVLVVHLSEFVPGREPRPLVKRPCITILRIGLAERLEFRRLMKEGRQRVSGNRGRAIFRESTSTPQRACKAHGLVVLVVQLAMPVSPFALAKGDLNTSNSRD